MSKLVWDQTGEKLYQIGLDKAVFFPIVGDTYANGIAWNGLVSISDNSDADFTPLLTNNHKVGSEKGSDELTGKIVAYTFPKEFDQCLGSYEILPGMYAYQQSRARFGISYRTMIGNDTDGSNYGYKIHILYNLGIVGNGSDDSSTISNDISPQKLSFDFDSIPEPFQNLAPVSHLVFDSTVFNKSKLSLLESILYGSTSTNSRLPLPDELYTLLR